MCATVSKSQIEGRPTGPDYLSSLPAEVRLLIFGHCFADSVINRSHGCWNVSKIGHSLHKHNCTPHRNILLASKLFYHQGIELYYARSLLHVDYCCMQTCFTNPKTPSILIERLQRARRLRLVENFNAIPPPEVLGKYMSLFPRLELLLINTYDWTDIAFGFCKDAGDEELLQWVARQGDIERYRKMVQQRPSLKIRFRKAFMNQEWELVRVDVSENGDGSGLLNARFSLFRSDVSEVDPVLAGIEYYQSRFDEECS